jgi:uncharacterized protein (TIGR02646 family)
VKKINKNCPDFYSNACKGAKTWADVKDKPGLHRYMLDNEQNGQCAYTEISVTANNSHIDHFVKQEFLNKGLFRHLDIFDWENLFTACMSEEYGAKYKDKHKHIRPEDYKFLINPATENPADYLEYTFTGDILAKDNNAKGEQTIRLFNLNAPALKERRKAVALQLNSYGSQFSCEELVKDLREFESMVTALYPQLPD